jgi:membrane protein implicated in regulation of membrane protease activity
MVWIIGAVCMIFFGLALVAVGWSVAMLGYAIVGGILALAGIFLLVSMRRTRRQRNMPPLR